MREALAIAVSDSFASQWGEDYWDAGWTADLVETVAGWARFAVAHRTGPYLEYLRWTYDGLTPVPAGREPAPGVLDALASETVREVTQTLLKWSRVLGMKPELLPWALGWTRVAVGLPSEEALKRWQDAVAEWTPMPLGALAGLSWAAGFSQREARSRLKAGRLQIEELEILAALGGFALPAAARFPISTRR